MSETKNEYTYKVTATDYAIYKNGKFVEGAGLCFSDKVNRKKHWKKDLKQIKDTVQIVRTIIEQLKRRDARAEESLK